MVRGIDAANVRSGSAVAEGGLAQREGFAYIAVESARILGSRVGVEVAGADAHVGSGFGVDGASRGSLNAQLVTLWAVALPRARARLEPVFVRGDGARCVRCDAIANECRLLDTELNLTIGVNRAALQTGTTSDQAR